MRTFEVLCNMLLDECTSENVCMFHLHLNSTISKSTEYDAIIFGYLKSCSFEKKMAHLIWVNWNHNWKNFSHCSALTSHMYKIHESSVDESSKSMPYKNTRRNWEIATNYFPWIVELWRVFRLDCGTSEEHEKNFLVICNFEWFLLGYYRICENYMNVSRRLIQSWAPQRRDKKD